MKVGRDWHGQSEIVSSLLSFLKLRRSELTVGRACFEIGFNIILFIVNTNYNRGKHSKYGHFFKISELMTKNDVRFIFSSGCLWEVNVMTCLCC